MNTHLYSDSITLRFHDNYAEYDAISELWQTLRRTTVEPGQSSHPDFASFADECLLCAHIVTNEPPTLPEAENEHPSESLWDPAESPVQGQPSSSLMTPATPSLTSASESVGLIYLHAGPANLQGGEANVGVITKPDAQRRGYAREAVQLVLRWAFEELKFHRVQAAILDTPCKDRALRLFIGSGFMHEGTKRRAVYQPEGEGMAGVWKDVTYLAMLDTEWLLKSMWVRTNRPPQPPVVSVWDEMFARHAREREELVQWEERHGRARRTASMETLRERTRSAAQDVAYLTDDASSVSASPSPSPRPNIFVSLEQDAHMADDLGPEEPPRWETVVETSFAARRQMRWTPSTLLNPSLHGHLLSLPSIPSTRLSVGSSPSPLTIPTPSTPESTPPPFSSTPPPFSPSPSPPPSSSHSTWSDSEDERNWLLREDPFTTPHDDYPRTAHASLRSRSRSSSVSSLSTDSWSDAQSSVGASSCSWEVISNASDRERA